MNEIDYAELDKEVSKVMADDADIDVRENKERKEEIKAPPEVEVGQRSRTVRGRYMDMVHPNSDMRPPARNYSTGKDIAAPDVMIASPDAAELSDMTEAARTDVGTEDTEEAAVEEDVVEDEGPEFGVIEDVDRGVAAEEDFIAEPEPMRDLSDTEEPNANNYSLGGKSPFIMDAKVEKRPLGNHVPEGSVRGVLSTKNVYSQRTPVNRAAADVKPTVVSEPKKRSGWMWALMTLLVVAAGGGLGLLAFMIYNN